MIHPELVGTRRSPSVAKGETPLPSMSSSKDPPAPNNEHLQNHIGSHCYKYKRDRKQTPLLAPASRTRGFREDRQNNKLLKLSKKSLYSFHGSRSIWNNKLLKLAPVKVGTRRRSRSIWNNKLLKLKPQKSAIASEIRRLRPLGRCLLSFNIIHRFVRRRQQSCTDHR